MQTSFTPQQLEDPDIARADQVLRKCVHCGFCMATCPTYLISGNELSAPRGRIYMIKRLLEEGEDGAAARDEEVVRHLDTCLTCLSCTTTCPSGVGYDVLVGIARRRLKDSPARSRLKRFWRRLMLASAPYPRRLRAMLRLSRPLAPLAGLLQGRAALAPAARMLEMARGAHVSRPLTGVFAPLHSGAPRGRVALLTGCAQSVLGRDISEATLKILRAAGFEVVVPPQAGCCGAMEHHLGEEERARARAAANVRAWSRADAQAVIIDASGCAGSVKEYGDWLADDPDLARQARRLSENAFELAEFLHRLPEEAMPVFRAPSPMRVAWHAPCSLTHHLRIADLPRELLRRAGHEIIEPAESHVCCGAGGANAVLEPHVADALRRRKLDNLQVGQAQLIATANFGCQKNLVRDASLPVRHYAELLAEALTPAPR